MEGDLVRHQRRLLGHMDAYLIFPPHSPCRGGVLHVCHVLHPWNFAPGFTVPLRCSWKYVGVRPFRYGRVRRTAVSRFEPPHVRELKLQATPSKKGDKKRPKELLRMTPPVKVAVIGSLFLWPKRRSVSSPVAFNALVPSTFYLWSMQ